MATATGSLACSHTSEGDIHIQREDTSQQLSRGGRHSCVSFDSGVMNAIYHPPATRSELVAHAHALSARALSDQHSATRATSERACPSKPPSQQRSRSPARSLRASSAASRHCLHQTLSSLPRRWPLWLRPSLMPKRPSLHGDSHQRRTLCSGRAARCTMIATAAWLNSMRPRPWTAWASGLGLRCRATSDSPLKPTMTYTLQWRQATRSAVPRRCARCKAVSYRRCSPRAASSAGYRRVA